MKCPKCKCKELDIDNCKGFSNDPIKTCKECGFKWVNRKGEEIKEV